MQFMKTTIKFLNHIFNWKLPFADDFSMFSMFLINECNIIFML